MFDVIHLYSVSFRVLVMLQYEHENSIHMNKIFRYSLRLSGFLILVPQWVSAAERALEYESYTSFPGVGRISTLCELTDALWQLGIIVLITSVFGSIVYAGFQYVTAGVNVNGVSDAKQPFLAAISGLILGLSSVLILSILNVDLLYPTCTLEYVGAGSNAFEDLAFGSARGSSSNGTAPSTPGESVCNAGYSIVDWKGNPATVLSDIHPHWPGTGGYARYRPAPGFKFGQISYIAGRPDQLVYDFSVTQGGRANGLPVPAPVSGTVVSAGGGMGVVGIEDSSGHVTRVLHLSGIAVSTGQEVSQCDVIGGQSDTGTPGSVHIHIETTQPILEQFIADLQ